MFIHKRIRTDKSYIEALSMNLGSKNLVVLKGSRGYVMCGYLNLAIANKFKDAAVKIVGVSNIEEACKTSVSSCTFVARRMGIYKGQSIREVLKIIA